MVVWIDDAKLRCKSVKRTNDILTVEIEDAKAPEEILALLCSAQKITKLDIFGSVQAVYKGMKLKSATVETVGGKKVITASMQASPADRSELDKLRMEIEALRAEIAEMKGAGTGV